MTSVFVKLYAKGLSLTIDKDTILSQNFEVPESVTCIIKPGVTIKFSGYYKFIVRGLVISQGTYTNPITFTCINRPHGAVLPPCWHGFAILGKKANAYFKHNRFEGMYRGLIWESNPVFDSCEFAGNHYAIYCTKKSMAHIKQCTFYRNIFGIVADFASCFLSENVVTDNSIGVYLQMDSKPILGRNNIFGNKINIKTEPALKGDSCFFSIQSLWELMNQLY